MENADIINIHPGNIGQEHICCAISDKKCAAGYNAKKQWLASQYDYGYRFRRLDARGKVFIEYVPARYAWLPVEAENFMVINCFWVSGQFKGHGYGKRLLQECLDDAAQMSGVVAITGDKKRPFMSDPKFLEKQGFVCVDSAPPFFRLWCKQFDAAAPVPSFKPAAKAGRIENSQGLVVFYSDTCPYTDYYTQVELRQYAVQHGIPLTIQKIETQAQAHALPIPWIIHSIFYNGELATLEMGPVNRLEKLLAGVMG